jgi:DNA-binding SARP family transcriptional activator
MDVRLTTLGTPSVVVNGEECKPLPGKPLSFSFLVFLALEGEATRDRLQVLFWPDSPPERARRALSQTLHDLRKELGEAWLESLGTLVRTTPHLNVDALEFERLTDEGRHQEALALYGGPFLEGVAPARSQALEEWVETRRAGLARRHRRAADAFIVEARRKGDLATALAVAEKWAALDHLDDAAQHHLIRLLVETGSRSEALAQYRRYESILQAELGLMPLSQTRELIAAIRSGAVTPPLPHTSTPAPPVWHTSPSVPESADPAHDWAQRRGELGRILDQELGESLQILRPIGRGSMADIFLARESPLKRLVAVKVLSSHLASDRSARRRFEREAQAAARINHPNVCTVHRVGSLSDGTPYYVSPFVRGTSLAHRLKAEGRLPPPEVRQVIRGMAAALAAAHRLGILHRDVRPDNILHEEETGRLFLCDFGIAGVLETGESVEERITRTGEVLGHPAYMSPEQTAGGPLTDRADVYSLGVMAHELLTGRVPPPGKTPGRGGDGRADRPDLGSLRDYIGASDPDLVNLIEHCLATDPTHRPSAADIAGDAGAGEVAPGARS